MRRLIALFTLLFLHTVCPLGPAGAAPPVRGYAVAEEVIVPGEAPDLARVTAYTRARLKLIQQLAEIVHDQTPSPALSGEDLEAAIADHVTVRILREVQREEMESMHVTVEIEGTVEPRAWRTATLHTGLFRQEKGELSRLQATANGLREDMGREANADRRIEKQLQLERLDIEAVRLACFAPYALAGEGFCADYRRQAGDDFRLVSIVLDCGGDPAWRVFSPFHRIAAFLSEHLQTLEEHRETPHEVLEKHLRHKQAVFAAHPYLHRSKQAQLFDPVTWSDTQGARREIPITDWSRDMVMTVLQHELTLWQGITIGWHIMRDGLTNSECAQAHRDATEPSIAKRPPP